MWRKVADGERGGNFLSLFSVYFAQVPAIITKKVIGERATIPGRVAAKRGRK